MQNYCHLMELNKYFRYAKRFYFTNYQQIKEFYFMQVMSSKFTCHK